MPKSYLIDVITKKKNDLKRPETSWNHLKPLKNYLKLPEMSNVIVSFT